MGLIRKSTNAKKSLQTCRLSASGNIITGTKCEIMEKVFARVFDSLLFHVLCRIYCHSASEIGCAFIYFIFLFYWKIVENIVSECSEREVDCSSCHTMHMEITS